MLAMLGKNRRLGIIRRPEASFLSCWLHSADVAELVDALDLGSSIERCESSSLSVRTSIAASALAFPLHKAAFAETNRPTISLEIVRKVTDLSCSRPVRNRL